MEEKVEDYDVVGRLTAATDQARRRLGRLLESTPTDADLDHAIHQVTRLSAATVAVTLSLKETLKEARQVEQGETWVRADWIATAYDVGRKWVYNHQERLGGISRGHRTLRFPLSKVIEELGHPSERHLSAI